MTSKQLVLLIIAIPFTLFLGHIYWMVFTTSFVGAAVIIVTIMWLIVSALTLFNGEDLLTFIERLKEES